MYTINNRISRIDRSLQRPTKTAVELPPQHTQANTWLDAPWHCKAEYSASESGVQHYVSEEGQWSARNVAQRKCCSARSICLPLIASPPVRLPRGSNFACDCQCQQNGRLCRHFIPAPLVSQRPQSEVLKTPLQAHATLLQVRRPPNAPAVTLTCRCKFHAVIQRVRYTIANIAQQCRPIAPSPVHDIQATKPPGVTCNRRRSPRHLRLRSTLHKYPLPRCQTHMAPSRRERHISHQRLASPNAFRPFYEPEIAFVGYRYKAVP